jgi:hypothetical protein
MVLGACGGGDDGDADETTGASAETSDLSAQTTTTTAPLITIETTSTAAPTTTIPVVYVTEGATVIVANASRIDGAAGRLTERLAEVGFVTAEPTDSTEGSIAVTKIYYVASNPAALPVAESLRGAFGGGDIQLLEVGIPAPVESGELGDATVLVAMGNDIADKTLAELQGLVPPATTAAPASDDTTAPASDDTTAPATDDTAVPTTDG